MGESGQRSRGGAPVSGQDPARGVDGVLPSAGWGEDCIGSRRFLPVQQQRDDAAAQIGRTLKAWRKASGGAQPSPQIPKGTGGSLSEDVRARMEPQLGADLSNVKVHTGGDSAQAARGLGARAFTVGDDVHFNAGEFAPGTKEGDKLLAHELTHVVQGQKSGIFRMPGGDPRSRDPALFDKLKALGSSKPDKALANILDQAPSLKEHILSARFEGCANYSTVIGQLQIPNEAVALVPVFAEAKRMLGSGFKIEFEKTNNTAPKYDVDFAAIDPATGEIHAFAVKGFDNLAGGFSRRLNEAATQLKNFTATKKIAAVTCRSRETLAEVKTKFKNVLDAFKANNPGTIARVTMSDGSEEFA